jgi:Family of unknown function (DUF6510)
MLDDRSIEERLAAMREDPALHLTTDGSSIGGLLMRASGHDATTDDETCAHCGTVSVLATTRVYSRGPGVIIRCPACTEVMMRIVETPTGLRIDVSGLALG